MKTKVNNNIKLKSGGGLVNSAVGLGVDSGTTEGKVVVVGVGDKLPAVDGSQLTGLTEFKIIPNENISTTGGTYYGSMNDLTKVKEVTYNNIAGRVRVIFSVTCNNNNNTRARVYINGIAVGTDYGYMMNGTYIKTEDFNVSTGDKIQIYASGNPSVGINYFNICYIKVATTTNDTVNL